MKLTILPKLLLYILAPSLVGLCTLATLNYTSSEKAIVALVKSEMNYIALGQSGEFHNIFTMLQSALKTVTSDTTVQNFMLSSDGGNPELRVQQLESVRRIISSVASNYARIKDVAIVNNKGLVVAHSSRPAFEGTNLGDRVYIKSGLAGKSTVDTVISKATNEMTSAMAYPIVIDGNTVGAVYMTLNLQELAKNTVDEVKLGTTGLCYVLDAQGQMIMHADPKVRGQDMNNNPWMQQIRNINEGYFEYDWQGTKRIGSLQRVALSGWTVVVAVNSSDIYAPLTRMFYTNSITVGIIILLLAAIILAVSINFSRVLKSLAFLVNHIGAGNFRLDNSQQNALYKMQQRGDEISSLSAGVELMTSNLKNLFEDAEHKTQQAHSATEEAKQATEKAHVAQTAAEHAKRDGMLAAAGQLESVVENLTSASTELSAQIELSEQGAHEQAGRIDQTATAMEQMTATVLEVARNASKASELSIHSREKASQGAQLVEASLKSMHEIQAFSLTLKDDMLQLNEKAQSITHIMSVISDIADQTNLLALNAAIEAARAGDAGRGFAVVADEVRKLAEKTMGSTSQVGNAIADIQNSTTQSMQQVDSTVQRIGKTTQQSQESGDALKEIVALIDATVDQVRSIATASEEQSATSQEINQAISDVNAVSAETSRAMQEASRAVEDLAQQAQNLNQLIADMKNA